MSTLGPALSLSSTKPSAAAFRTSASTKGNLIQLGYGINQKRIQATTTNNTPAFAVEMAGNKNRTKDMLDEAGIPVPKGTHCVIRRGTCGRPYEALGFPIVTKPLDGNHGKGATININTLEGSRRRPWSRAEAIPGGYMWSNL